MDGSLINYPIRLARAAGIPEVGYQPVTGPKTIWTEMCPCQHERNPSTGPLIISERSNTRSLFGSSVPLERDNHSPTCWFVVWYYRATGWTWPPRVRWEHVNQLELKAVHQNYNRFLLSWAHPWWTCPMSSHCRSWFSLAEPDNSQRQDDLLYTFSSLLMILPMLYNKFNN